jgi:transcriptional regulator with PAS, ATPase and Fis domain
LFIDEIGELDLALQPRLLRAIDTREIRPVGGDAYRGVDVRIIAATNRNLEEEVAAGRFREDLFHRLAVVRVRIPPLRERKEDLALLAQRFLGDRALSPDAMAVLSAYDWPGNVREMRNVVERAVARVPAGGVIGVDRLGLHGEDMPALTTAHTFLELREQLIEVWERHTLEQLMERCGGNVSRAAREGGLDRAYLHRLLKRHNLGRWAR